MSDSGIEKGLDAEIEKEWAEMKEEIFGTKEDQIKIDAENKRFAQREYERAIKAGGVMKELAVAAKIAKSGMESDDLMPTKGELGSGFIPMSKGLRQHATPEKTWHFNPSNGVTGAFAWDKEADVGVCMPAGLRCL